MPIKLTPYQKLLAMGKEAVASALAPVRARSAKKQAELEMCKIEEQISTLEGRVTEACSAYPVSFDTVIEHLNQIALAERRRGQFEKIIEEMFPDK